MMTTWGMIGVDYEQRVDYDRLRRDRLARSRDQLARHELGALLVFDYNNIRYITATHLSEAIRDKMARAALLPAGGDPVLWDFGSAVKVWNMRAPWMQGRVRPGRISMRGAVPPDVRLVDGFVEEVKALLNEHGVANEPLGIDVADTSLVLALQAAGIKVADGNQAMQDARRIKTPDEVQLLETAAALADAAYGEVVRNLRAGIRENEVAGLVNKLLYDMGSDDVECVQVISGPRTNPHPHLVGDRVIRPGDLVYMDIMHAFNGYRTCYYRTFFVGKPSQQLRDAHRQCRDWLYAGIDAVRPGATTADIAGRWPAAAELGFESEVAAFGLQFAHGIGLSIWEKPVVSRLFSLEKPFQIEEGMVFALENYCPTKDGAAGARIEEEVVVTQDGCRVITRYPCDELVAVDP
ncbi:MAG: aminopeptidase P family protein [Chloroflexi bacterium]|nr:aminopeptidase P family protein [Chloroflexota bacterium]